MEVIKEGTITILPDGRVLIKDFEINGGNIGELYELAMSRVLTAAERMKAEAGGWAR